MKHYRWMKRILFSTIALIAVLLGVIIPNSHAIGQESPFYWQFINADIKVQTNGDMLVTETQQ